MDFRLGSREGEASPSLHTPESERSLVEFLSGKKSIHGSEMLTCPVLSHDYEHAIIRVLEKKRIRDEIIAREIIWRRELEHEVRRELAEERGLAMGRLAMGCPLYPEGPISFTHLHNGKLKELDLVPSIVEGSAGSLPSKEPPETNDKLQFPSQSSVCAVQSDRSPTKQDLQPHTDNSKAIIEPKKPISSDSEAIEAPGKPLVPERAKCVVPAVKDEILTKAKAEILTTLNMTNKSKLGWGWTCDICNICLNSEAVFCDHIHGRKHKVKAARYVFATGNGALNVQTTDLKEESCESAATLLPVKCSTSCEQSCQDVCSDKLPRKKPKIEYVCKECDVFCFSEKVLEDHYQGRKHKAKVERLHL